MSHLFGTRVIESAACPPGVIFLVGPPPRREDYATDDEWATAYMQHIVRVEVSNGRRSKPRP